MVVSNIFLVSSVFGKDSHFDEYFSDWLKPPTSYGLVDVSYHFLICNRSIKICILRLLHRKFWSRDVNIRINIYI